MKKIGQMIAKIANKETIQHDAEERIREWVRPTADQQLFGHIFKATCPTEVPDSTK